MKRKLFIALLVLFTAAIGCKKTANEIDNTSIEIGEIKNHIVSALQAESIAVLHSIYPENLKSSSKKNNDTQLSSITIVAKKQNPQKSVKKSFSLKEGQVDPTAYVINYTEGGFVIVSGDDRMVPVLAFSDKGSFEMTEISKLPGGVSHWLKANHKYIGDLRSGKVKNTAEQNSQMKSLWKEFEYKNELQKGNFATLTVPACNELNVGNGHHVTEEYGPLTATEWGQGAGYNSSIPMAEWPYSPCSVNQNGHQLVGCVGVAVAQVMAYHQSPSTYSWSLMPPNTGSGHTSQLMYDVAGSVNTFYGCNYSFSDGTAAKNALNDDWGYPNATKDSYDFNTVYNDIKWGKPVILFASDSFLEGHMWVADGVQVNQSLICIEFGGPIEGKQSSFVPPPTEYGWLSNFYSSYLRMNWGWNGEFNDAWYSSYAWSVGTDTYDNGMKMITGIAP